MDHDKFLEGSSNACEGCGGVFSQADGGCDTCSPCMVCEKTTPEDPNLWSDVHSEQICEECGDKCPKCGDRFPIADLDEDNGKCGDCNSDKHL